MTWSPLMRYLLTIEEDNPEFLTLLYTPRILTERTILGSNLLHACALYDRPKMCELLLKKEDVNSLNEYGETPLHWVCKSGAIKTCELFLKHGAIPNVIDADGNSPLHWCCEYNNYKLLQLLLECKVDVNIENMDGYTPLEIAVKYGSFECAKLLIKTPSVDLSHYNEIAEESIFHCANFSESEDVMQLVVATFSKLKTKKNKNRNWILFRLGRSRNNIYDGSNKIALCE